jgi:pimeloyl-ACP methyl ester carboxylesterase
MSGHQRHTAVLMAAAVLAALLPIGASAKGFFEMPRAQLEAKYSDAASKFVEIDGVRVHYKDEGTGSVVVLLHASYMNLHAWDGLADRLKKDHRVIRLDLLTAGLTGVDTKDRYSMERNEELLDGLSKKLDVHQYALVGTSSGGMVAFRRAAAHPEETTRLVLINSAGMPRTAATDPIDRAARRCNAGGAANINRATTGKTISNANSAAARDPTRRSSSGCTT